MLNDSLKLRVKTRLESIDSEMFKNRSHSCKPLDLTSFFNVCDT